MGWSTAFLNMHAPALAGQLQHRRDFVAWILLECSIFNGLGDSANFEEFNIINVLAYPCTNALAERML